ncbi:MAG: ProQ/FinO family protein, partial [Rubrivivax sp.]
MSNENPAPETPLPETAPVLQAEVAAADVADAIVAAPAAAASAAAVPDMAPAAVAAKLAELFPALFAAQPPLPLKLRIQADIQLRAPGLFTKKSLSMYLHRLTMGTPYLIALTQAPGRFDLDGQPAGDLAAEHREA